MKKPTKREKAIWNEAVKTTLKEVKKYDGLIPSEFDRGNMVDSIGKKVLYKTETTTNKKSQ